MDCLHRSQTASKKQGLQKKPPTRYGEQNNQNNVALYDPWHHMQKKFSKYVSSAEDREDNRPARKACSYDFG